MGYDHRDKAREHKPADGDTLESIAKQETDAGNPITWQEIARFNWGTDSPDTVDEFLRDELGSYVRGANKRFVMSADAAVRTPLLIPELFKKAGLSTTKTHKLKVRKKAKPPKQFEGCTRVEGVTFEFDSDKIRASETADVEKAAEAIKAKPDTKAMIFGHTDKVGSEAYNKDLSERRAKSLFTYLTTKSGIDPGRFMDPKHMGCGEFNPETDTEAAHEPNRRVTVFLFNPDRLPNLPCLKGDLAPCKKQIAAPLPRNKDSFHCSFYDSIAKNCPAEGGGPVAVSVTIKAENGKDNPLTAVHVKDKIKFKAVPSSGTGTYQWSTDSGKVTLEDDTQQTVVVVAGKEASAAPEAEEIKLVFTPSGAAPLASVSHKFGVCKVKFSKEDSHAWGYDLYQKFKSEDGDKNKFDEQPDPPHDFVSVKKSEVGKVKVTIEGCKPADIFFVSQQASVCEPKVPNPDSATYVLEIQGKSQRKKVTLLEARVGSATGTVGDKVGVVVLEQIDYKAEWFRVKDPDSPKTNLSLSVKGAEIGTAANDYYKQGVAVWDVIGGDSETEVKYDPDKLGMLALEPGKTTKAEKKIMKACKSSRVRAIYVKQIKWFYYFRADASKTDKKIKLKNYGATYLGYIGATKRTIIDKNGDTVVVDIKKVDTATGDVELNAEIGKDFKKSDDAALIFPLGGLSGDPVWVGDMADADTLKNYAAHELGHELSDLKDIAEIDNFMFGGSETGKNLRHREQKKYYKPTETEKQWTKMKGR